MADLSSLWAGPLCAQLLARAGATVVKVESPNRPDGTRRGEPAFFDWMNSGKLCYAVDFDSDSDALRRLLAAADIVIEGSRPAALRRHALSVDDVPARPRSNLVAHQRLSRPAGPAGIRRRRRSRRRTGRRRRRRTGVLRGRDRGPAERTGGGARGGGVAAPRWRRGDRRVDGPGRRPIRGVAAVDGLRRAARAAPAAAGRARRRHRSAPTTPRSSGWYPRDLCATC